MQSQIPPVAARYFEQRRVDVAEFHPVVTSLFSPTRGWRPAYPHAKVSHSYLVQLRDSNDVTGVVLFAGGVSPDFTIDELVGDMTALDAEFTDGIPVSEGSGVVADRGRLTEILAELGFSKDDAQDALDRADKNGVEFTSERRGFCAVDARGTFEEGWRYRLTARKEIVGGGPGYELSVLVHETTREA